MVKGISKQVIVVRSPDPRLFEQVIFFLKEDAIHDGISDAVLLKEAQQVLSSSAARIKKHKMYVYGAFCAGIGAAVTGLLWLIASLF